MNHLVCSQHGVIELIFVEDTIANQQYLLNEVILIIQGAGCTDTSTWQDGAHSRAASVILDTMHDVFGSCVLLN